MTLNRDIPLFDKDYWIKLSRLQERFPRHVSNNILLNQLPNSPKMWRAILSFDKLLWITVLFDSKKCFVSTHESYKEKTGKD